jgi:hypothetical protein
MRAGYDGIRVGYTIRRGRADAASIIWQLDDDGGGVLEWEEVCGALKAPPISLESPSHLSWAQQVHDL